MLINLNLRSRCNEAKLMWFPDYSPIAPTENGKQCVQSGHGVRGEAREQGGPGRSRPPSRPPIAAHRGHHKHKVHTAGRFRGRACIFWGASPRAPRTSR